MRARHTFLGCSYSEQGETPCFLEPILVAARAYAFWGGRPKLAAASFGSCAVRLNGPQRSGACCDACT